MAFFSWGVAAGRDACACAATFRAVSGEDPSQGTLSAHARILARLHRHVWLNVGSHDPSLNHFASLPVPAPL